ncbi:MAG: hypothetical protein HUU50_12770 [Candidatus Brocadiae bacterium]|nr:hypothetical protein [Candidatus Brocadiia bacterium]
MPAKLFVSLDFLHLENALFYAEQSIAGGIDFLEIGSLLLKNTGFNSVRIFKERFPSLKIVCDLKILQPQILEIEAASKSQIFAITISGAISEQNYQICLDMAQKNSLKAYLDFRGCAPCVVQNALSLIPRADAVIIDFFPQNQSISLFQQISSMTDTPIFLQPSSLDENTLKGPLGFASMLVVPIQESTSSISKEIISKAKNILNKIESQGEVSQKEYNEQTLREKLRKISTVHICEVYRKPIFLEKVYPLHRFTKILGRAYTLRVWPGEQKQVIQYLMEIPEQSILVVDAGGTQGNAVWSCLATEIAMKRKLSGAVVYGSISDVPYIRQKGFPCYAAALTAIPGQEENTASYNIPLTLGNVTIQPGDWMIGDDNGIVCIPSMQAFAIVDNAFELAKSRESILEELAALETPTTESLEKILVRYYQVTKNFSIG